MVLSGKITLIVFFILPLFVVAQNEESVQWSVNKKLDWNDYLAKPSSTSDAAAITSTSIGIEYHVTNNTFTYTVTCLFSKTRSWGRNKTDYILQHEQGHFDITEIFARKLAKELSDYKFNSEDYERQVNVIYKRIMDEKEEYQNRYDMETDFSRNKEKQAEWLDRIRAELEKSSAFADLQSSISI
jgi:predicted secreted Zn-dependent protease